MKLLAFDTSADGMSIAVSRDDGAAAGLWQMQGEGGAKASAGLIAGVLDLMRQANLELRALDAICFGCGPGYFTGLRTACAVAQGLAFGAGVPVLPVGSLLALAEDARYRLFPNAIPLTVSAMLDARMDEIYRADYHWNGTGWAEVHAPVLVRPEDLVLAHAPSATSADTVAAGNAFSVYGPRLTGIDAAVQRVQALPQATALLRLAPQLLAAGKAVPAEEALPVYVRDKVAQTTAERAATKAAQAAAL
jgi:tRNA threonylcarbamoyladenosine biosynthesis protein TsaB